MTSHQPKVKLQVVGPSRFTADEDTKCMYEGDTTCYRTRDIDIHSRGVSHFIVGAAPRCLYARLYNSWHDNNYTHIVQKGSCTLRVYARRRKVRGEER